MVAGGMVVKMKIWQMLTAVRCRCEIVALGTKHLDGVAAVAVLLGLDEPVWRIGESREKGCGLTSINWRCGSPN